MKEQYSREVLTAALPRTTVQTLEDQITELAAHINAATWQLLTLIREYDRRAGWNGGGTKSCAHWLNWKCGIALGAAREKVRVAHALAELPQVSDAFREGRLSYSKVRAITRAATPANEDYFLMIARHGTAAHVERLVQAYRRLGRRQAQEQLADRRLTCYVDDDGCYVIRGRLTPEQGERLMLALDAAVDDMPRDDDLSPSQRRADALERLADSFLASEESDSTGGDRYTVHVHTRVAELEAATIDDEDVSAETSRRAACDCGVVHWLENDRGQALDIGRRSRNITPALRRALQHRDGGCTFPGCTTRRHHHRQVHEGGYAVALLPSGEARFRNPDGTVLPAAADGRSRGNACALRERNLQEQPHIDLRTLPPHWYGDSMDLGMAIEGLLQRDGGSRPARAADPPTAPAAPL